MLTKAIIQNIDHTKNICRVRIPLFENASRNVNIIEADAQFSIVPGIYNSYKVGDIVFIGFEENSMESPVILGKLFVSASAEAAATRGNLSGNALSITDTAQLPYSTIFNYDIIPQNSALYRDLNTPKKLADSIINLQRDQARGYQTIVEVSIGDTPNTVYTYKLYLKTSDDFTYSPDKSDEPLYRLCTALKSSQAENTFIPLDLATSENIRNDGADLEEIVYAAHQAMFRIQEFNSDILKLRVVIDGSSYEVIKDDSISRNDIKNIQSIAIQY